MVRRSQILQINPPIIPSQLTLTLQENPMATLTTPKAPPPPPHAPRRQHRQRPRHSAQARLRQRPDRPSDPQRCLRNSSLPHQPHGTAGKASPSELASTAQGQRILDSAAHSSQEARRHGRGPRQGEMVPELVEASTTLPSNHNPILHMPTNQPLSAVSRALGTTKLIERWKIEMPTEAEMLARDKYTLFDKKAKGYRKGVHKLPKWTRVSQRLNPPGF
jgi:hypothetical protein